MDAMVAIPICLTERLGQPLLLALGSHEMKVNTLEESRMTWYIDHRIEYLRNKLSGLRKVLEHQNEFDYDALREFMEIKGRLKELENLSEHLRDW
jgi:hypothetical protein